VDFILKVFSWAEAFMTAEETVRALLERLPDDCSLDDVQYHLYVVHAVERGVADAEADRTHAKPQSFS
jgi:hypothetical protein